MKTDAMSVAPKMKQPVSEELSYFLTCLVDSYRHFTGKNLLDPDRADLPLSERLFFTPFVLVSHGAEADPVLNFGNEKALELWEMSWEELTNTPSRKTAEPVEQEERQRLLERVESNGFIDDYSGIRISKSGKRFSITDAVVWNVFCPEKGRLGQAATFSTWHFL